MIDLDAQSKRRIAESLVRSSMRIGRKADGRYESVLIRYNSKDPSCVEFAELVEEECWKVGSTTLMRGYSSGRERQRYSLLPEESLRRWDPLQKAIAEAVDRTHVHR
jgi:hypothetical protein